MLTKLVLKSLHKHLKEMQIITGHDTVLIGIDSNGSSFLVFEEKPSLFEALTFSCLRVGGSINYSRIAF